MKKRRRGAKKGVLGWVGGREKREGGKRQKDKERDGGNRRGRSGKPSCIN